MIETEPNYFTQRGAIMLEGAVTLPLIIFLIIAICEISRYMTARGVLAAGANRAVSMASVDPRMASKIPQDRVDAMADLEAAAKSIPTSLLVGDLNSTSLISLVAHTQNPTSAVFIDVPVDKTTTYTSDPESLYENKVIRVSMAAQFRWVMPSLFGVAASPINITTEAVSFREKRLGFSEPKPVNCKGETVPVGDRNYWDQGCACPSNPSDPNAVYNPETSTCRCNINNSVMTPGAQCACVGEYTLVGGQTEQKQCVCTKQGSDCVNFFAAYPGMGRLNMDNCQCERCGYWGQPEESNPDTGYTTCRCKITNAICNSVDGVPYGGGTTGGPHYASAWCDCRTCGAGTIVPTNGAAYDCDCSSIICPNNLHTTSYNYCQCGCLDNGTEQITDPMYGPVCRPLSCQDGGCTYNPGTKTWTRNE